MAADVHGCRGGAAGTIGVVAVVRMFAGARAAAGRGSDEVPGVTVAAVLRAAEDRYGPAFGAVLGQCRGWVNGEPADPDTVVGAADEVAVLPPVSGGER